MTEMLDLCDLEIDEVSGGYSLLQWVGILNLVLDFGSGFVDGVNAYGSN